MRRNSVRSSNIRSVGYDGGTLEIEFHESGVYQYNYVPEHIYRGLMSAVSKGSYFHDHIRDRFAYLEVVGW
jgi:hypothetical protein